MQVMFQVFDGGLDVELPALRGVAAAPLPAGALPPPPQARMELYLE